MSVTPSASNDWISRAVSPAEAVAFLRSGSRVFLHGAAATPSILIQSMVQRRDLEKMVLYHFHIFGEAPFVDPEAGGRFHSVSLFAGETVRSAIQQGDADVMPIFLSDIPHLFQSGRVPLDAAILHLSPPDRHGFCTLGTSVDAALAASRSARTLIAEINTRMPRTHGQTTVHIDRLAAYVVTDHDLMETVPPAASEVDTRIGEIVAALVEDRSTLQLGIGTIPNAVLARLGEKRDLGIHGETFSDGVVDLFEAGVVTNRYKTLHPGRIVTSFVVGSRRVFDFVDDNPVVEFQPCDQTNDTSLIRRNERMVAINSALQIDLSGQVCADSIGHKIHSGIGGQMDFIRGAALSHGGKPIIALPSTALGGSTSRIVAELSPGSGVVTTRGHVHWVVTEYGAVNLHGATMRERSEALISIAHPDYRAELRKDADRIRLRS